MGLSVIIRLLIKEWGDRKLGVRDRVLVVEQRSKGHDS